MQTCAHSRYVANVPNKDRRGHYYAESLLAYWTVITMGTFIAGDVTMICKKGRIGHRYELVLIDLRPHGSFAAR